MGVGGRARCPLTIGLKQQRVRRANMKFTYARGYLLCTVTKRTQIEKVFSIVHVRVKKYVIKQ